MVKLALPKRSIPRLLRKISAVSDMIFAGIAVAAMINEASMSLLALSSLVVFASASILLELLADLLEEDK